MLMDFVDSGGVSTSVHVTTHGSSSIPASTFTQDAMWQLNLRSPQTMEYVSYPERPGEQDCSYYMRTGMCRFGATCRFNHPPNRTMIIENTRLNGEFPERIGQPECQYYLKTGTCKFGPTCKFHHPREKAGIAGRVTLNVLGYPIRTNENDCSYYRRKGECKFGSTCKFNHPQPSNLMVSVSGSPAYPPVNSPTNPSLQSYPGVTNWPLSRASFIPSPRWQGASSYGPLMLPPGVVSIPGWNAYGGQIGSMSSTDGRQHQAVVNNQVYGTSRQSENINPGSQGSYSQYRPGTVPLGMYALPGDNVFPERPGQPECQFYMKTGDCKFGAVCRFHHPRERAVPAPDCSLSPLGLPLRQGEPICVFYSRYGICKFGPSCKFDHPMGIFKYNLPTSTSSGLPVVRRLMGSSSGNVTISLSSDGPVDSSGSTKPRRLSLSGDDSINREG